MKINETCCTHNGVPEECMGLCREGRQRRGVFAELPANRCDEHLQKINSCVYEGIGRLLSNNLIP